MEQPIRQVAYKVWISDLINNPVIRENEEFSPNHVVLDGKKVSRVNLIANVTMKYKSQDSNYGTITIDDGSSEIQIKAWKEDISFVNDVNIGDTVLFVGRIREYNSQNYLIPEIIKILDKPEWLELRKKELAKIHGDKISTKITGEKDTPSNQSFPLVLEESIGDSNSIRQKILKSIRNLDSIEGADIVEVIVSSKISEEEANLTIQELLKEGEIFEIRSGRLKIIE